MQRLYVLSILVGAVLSLGLPHPHIIQAASLSPQAELCAEVYTVQSTDWLSKVSEKFLGDITAYPAIVNATNLLHQSDPSFATIDNPDIIEAGWKLCIPVTSEAEAMLTELGDGQSNPTPAPLPPPLPDTVPALYTLDTFVTTHQFSPNTDPAWIYTSPEKVSRYQIPAEKQEIDDTYGYRANYYWNEHLSDDYFLYSGIFDAVPPEVNVYKAPWGSVLPRYRYPPNTTLPTGLTTNRFGWRGSQIALKKSTNTIRIAAVGASTTVGGHTLPFSYPEFLEHWLNLWSAANGYDVKFEVINAGREGLNSNDIAAVVRYEVLPLDIDYVIYYEGSNQFHPETVVTFPPEYTMGKPPTGVVPNFNNVDSEDKNLLDKLSEYSALAARARNIVEQFLVTGHEPPKPEQQFVLPAGLDEFNPDRNNLGDALALRRILKDIDQLKQDLDDNQVKMVMTTFNWFAYDNMVLDPTRHRNLYGYLNRVYWPISYANMRRAADFQNRVFKDWATRANVPLIDVARQMPKQPDLYDDAIHNTYLGSRIRAWIIFESLLPMLKQDIENHSLPAKSGDTYKQHPYITDRIDTRQLLDSVSRN
jgi:hypothetical protein